MKGAFSVTGGSFIAASGLERRDDEEKNTTLLFRIFSAVCFIFAACFCQKYQLHHKFIEKSASTFKNFKGHGTKVLQGSFFVSVGHRFRTLANQIKVKIETLSMPHFRAGQDIPKDTFDQKIYLEKLVWAEKASILEAKLRRIDAFFSRNLSALSKYSKEWKEFKKSWWNRRCVPPIKEGKSGDIIHERYLLQRKTIDSDYKLRGYRAFIEDHPELQKLLQELFDQENASTPTIPIGNELFAGDV